MPKPGWKSVSLPEEMVGEIDGVIEQRPELGYKGVRSFVTSAVRRMIGETRPALEHYNLNPDGVLILDRTLNPDRIIQVYFRPEGAWCEFCEIKTCKHANFALNIPKVQEILREKGWSIKKEKS